MKITFIIFLFILNAMATNEKACLKEVEEVGGEKNISIDCFDIKTKLSTIYNHKIYQDEGITIKALKNIIFIKKGDELHRIAGPKTKLCRIDSLDIDLEEQKIFALNNCEGQGVSIEVFGLKGQGNVYPLGRMKQLDIPKEIKQIIFLQKSRKLLGLAQNGFSLYVIRPGISDHSSQEARPKILETHHFSNEIKYLHDPGEGITLVYKNGEWVRMNSLEEKAILDKKTLNEKLPFKLPAGLTFD